MARKTMLVREAMTPSPQTCGPDTPVADAARLMASEDVGSVPIVQGERLIGILTDRDVAVRVVAAGKDAMTLPVGGVASREVVTVEPDQPLEEALKLMARHQLRRVPVVEEGHRLIGILAQADVALAVDESRTGEIIGEISEPR
jgi:CBS domain-containing protein